MSLYWFYVIGNLSCCVCILFWVSLVPLGVLCCNILFADYYDEEEKEERHKKWCKGIAIFSSMMLIASIFAISSEDLMKIYVVDNAVEYIGNNDKARELPDKVIECCDKLMNEYLEEDKDE